MDSSSFFVDAAQPQASSPFFKDLRLKVLDFMGRRESTRKILQKAT